jgi:DNA-binding CsgD family transcriptional regulator/predicted ATPase
MTESWERHGAAYVLESLSHENVRAVAVFGPAGAGKSRIVWSAARTCERATVVVDCARTADPANALRRLSPEAGDVLLVLDDLEHLDRERRSWLWRAVEDVSAEFPAVKVLATDSRADRLPGVVSVPVGRLAVPVDHTVTDLDELARTPSVSAFTEAMRQSQPEFALDARNRADVADICAAVHGVPGHLVLAARMADTEGLDAIALALARGDWDDRLAVLVAKHAERSDRHGLDQRERCVVTAASLCPDGFGAEAMRHITGLPEVEQVLERLTEDGLLDVLEPGSATMASAVAHRYRLPLPVLAAVRPDATGERALGAAHSEYYLRLAEAHAAGVWTPQQSSALLGLRQDRRNITAALRWAIENGRESRAVELVASLAPYWRWLADLTILRSWVVELIGRQSSLPAGDAHRLNVLAAEVFARLGEHEAALDAIEVATGVATAAQVGEAGIADRMFATGLALHATAGSRAAEQLRRAAERYRAIGDEAGAVAVEFDLCASEFRLGRRREADRTARAALSSATRRGDELSCAALLLRLGAFAAVGGDPRAASVSSAYVERALAKLRGLGAAAAVGVLACQVDTYFEPSVVRRATDLARVLGSFSAHHRADFGDVSPDFVVGHQERRLRDQLGERALAEAAASGARVPLPELFAEIATHTLGADAAEHAASAQPTLLTRRETDVALLVGEGLTNREVARRLAISEWTVVNHMRHIMRKLDCTSRVQIARWVSATL